MNNFNLLKKFGFFSIIFIVLISLIMRIKCIKSHAKHLVVPQKDISEIYSDMKNLLQKISSLFNTMQHNLK